MMFAAFVQSVGGFGFSLMAVPLAALATNLSTAIIVVSIGALFNVSMLWWRARRDVDRPLAWRFNIPALMGMPIGLWILTNVNQRPLKITLGVVIIVATIALMRGWSHVGPSSSIDVIAGWISGVLSTATGTNGPPLVIAAQMRRLAPAPFRATLALTFMVSGAVTLVLYAASGLVTQRDVLIAIGAVPMMVLGQKFGLKVQSVIESRNVERLVVVLLLASGVSVGVSGVVS